MSDTATVVVIPTRNRAQIVTNAIRSVLEQSVENVQIMVSDNSTSEADQQILMAFCSKLADDRLRYVQPPRSLAMTEHWDWALQNALHFYPETSHFVYLTDRMMFRSGGFGKVVELAALFPDKVISYNLDRIVDNADPIRVEQYPGSGKLLELDTLRISWLLSQAVIHPAVPRMLNCIVPRPVLERIRERFGDVFSSISPDFSFCCRCLELEDSILFYDKSPIFHYALSRSNGASVTRGEMTTDYRDFTANLSLDNLRMNFATPVPQLNTAVNAAFHEYCLFKQQTNSSRFFELDVQKYLHANANEIHEIIDPAVRAEMFSLLIANGYRETVPNGERKATKISLRARIHSKIKRILTSSMTTSGWMFLARALAITPPGQNQFEFATVEQAINYAKNISRGNILDQPTHKDLLKAREIVTR